jgi:hypothetical protein
MSSVLLLSLVERPERVPQIVFDVFLFPWKTAFVLEGNGQ